MLKRTRIGRGLVVVLVVGSMLFGATAAFAAETDRAGDRRANVATDRPVGRFGAWVIGNTMEILDVNRGQIVSTLAKGDTLADLATAQGSSGDEQAAAFMERVTAAVDKAVFEPHHPGDRVRDGVRRHLEGIRRLLWQTTVEFLDVKRGEIVSTFAKGETLADLAVEQGSTGEALVGVLVAVVDEKLTIAVETGVISSEKKDELLSNATEAIETFVFTPHHPGRGNDAA